jgi:hypothetical protein
MSEVPPAPLPAYALQQVDWRVRTTLYLINLVPEADRQTVNDMLDTCILQAETDGFDHARRLVNDIAAGAAGNRTAQVIARHVTDLRIKNYGPLKEKIDA